MVLPYSVFLVLDRAAPASAVVHSSCLLLLSMGMLCCEAVYGGGFSFWNLHVWCSNLLALVSCFFPMCLLYIFLQIYSYKYTEESKAFSII
jgi:hypothetical protein